MRFFEFANPLVEDELLMEAARIQHAEDVVFWEGSKGAIRALHSLRNMDKGSHKDTTIKWDGSPAVIFGRDEEGNFIFTDKSGFTAKGYDGKAKSAEHLEKMLTSRPGFAKNPKGYGPFIAAMKSAYNSFERAVPLDYRGFFKGDMLYFTTPKVKNGEYVFTPNIVTYSVDVDSELGNKIGKSVAGVVIHRQVGPDGTESPLDGYDIFQGEEVLVVPPVTVEKEPFVPHDSLNILEKIIKKDAAAIDTMLDTDTLRALKITDFPQVLYAYTNSKVDTGLTEMGKDFGAWLKNSKLSERKKQNIAQYISENSAGWKALWEVVGGIMKAKDEIIYDIDSQGSTVKQSIAGQGGGEGYVLAHPEGDIKLVPREYFSKANRAARMT